MNVMLSTLQLVYPPVSSFEADFLKEDPDVEALIRTSDFYMIAMRPEVLFEKVEGHGYEAGLIEPFEWFSTEKLLHDRRRGVAGITGLGRVRDFATYELLYVGIAKKTDTFNRLFKKAHHARQKILSGEWPRRAGSRVTDELILFPFRVEPTILQTFEVGEELTDTSNDAGAQYRKRVVADAEKAFVKLLDPQYNVEKFANYPQGVDGLYGGEHQRYGYLIAEDVTFTTENGTMRGSLNPQLGTFDDSADLIFVTGESVELVGQNQTEI